MQYSRRMLHPMLDAGPSTHLNDVYRFGILNTWGVRVSRTVPGV